MATAMSDKEDALEKNLEAFRREMSEMERHHMDKWVIFHEGRFVDAFDTLDNAAHEAVKRYGRGPYLIKQVGGPDKMSMPASVMFGSG